MRIYYTVSLHENDKHIKLKEFDDYWDAKKFKYEYPREKGQRITMRKVLVYE